MKIGINQPYFLPYIGYWQLINYVDKYLIYDDVNFIKNGWINRNFILANSNKLLFTIPLKGASSYKKINEIELNNYNRTKSKLLKTIKQSYSKSPYYCDAFPLIEEIFQSDYILLIDIIKKSIFNICKYLDIKTTISLSSSIGFTELKSIDRLLALIKENNCNTYVNAIGGIELYSKKKFAEYGIDLYFLKSNTCKYNQFDNEFIDRLSIIDILMFCDKKNIKKMLDNFILV